MAATDPIAELKDVIERVRAAQARYEADGSQTRYDRAAQAVAWAIIKSKAISDRLGLSGSIANRAPEAIGRSSFSSRSTTSGNTLNSGDERKSMIPWLIGGCTAKRIEPTSRPRWLTTPIIRDVRFRS